MKKIYPLLFIAILILIAITFTPAGPPPTAINNGVVITDNTNTADVVDLGDINGLAVASGDFYLNVARSIYSNMSHVNKFGRNDDIDIASGYEAIWNGGDSYTGHDATAAETVELFSGEAADNASGTGARTVKVWGLDANWEQQTETVTMHASDGTTAVDTVNTYIRLDRMRVTSAGTGGANAGGITARQKTTTANIFAVLPIGYNSTMIMATTIPAGKVGYIVNSFASGSGATRADSSVRLKARPFGETFQVQEEYSITGAANSYVSRDYIIPKGPYTAKTDVVMEANTDTNNTGMAAGVSIVLIDN